MSGPVTALRVSVQAVWTRVGLIGSTATSGCDWEFVVTSFARTFAEKLSPPSVDFAKNTSLFPFRVSVHAMKMWFALSRASAGSIWFAPPASLFTRTGVVHVRPPSSDFVKKMSAWVIEPPHPVKARYATPSDPTLREGVPAEYAGGRSTCTFGPKCGPVEAAEVAGSKTPIKATARRAVIKAIGTARGIGRRAVGVRIMAVRSSDAPRLPAAI